MFYSVIIKYRLLHIYPIDSHEDIILEIHQGMVDLGVRALVHFSYHSHEVIRIVNHLGILIGLSKKYNALLSDKLIESIVRV